MADSATAALDGNAIAGLLADVFGRELTNSTGTCAACGASAEVGSFVVYLRGPGTVARCRSCMGLLVVLVKVREVTCVDLRGLASLQMP